MLKKLLAWMKKLKPEQRAIGVAVAIALMVVLFIIINNTPERSVAAYCKAYSQQKTRLAQLPGSTYSSAVFNEDLSDAGEFATAFGRLEKVAPTDISPDVASLGAIYQTMHDNPAQAIVASLSGVSAENSVTQWTQAHCAH